MSVPRILVVDDSPTILQLITGMLVDGGYAVLTAADGEEALRLAIEERPALILLDVILPKFNGYQVCRQLKSLPETAHIPVVMITRKAKESDRRWGMEQGADGYITKPFDLHDLLKIVDSFVLQETD